MPKLQIALENGPPITGPERTHEQCLADASIVNGNIAARPHSHPQVTWLWDNTQQILTTTLVSCRIVTDEQLAAEAAAAALAPQQPEVPAPVPAPPAPEPAPEDPAPEAPAA